METDYWEDDFSERSSDMESVRSETRSTIPQLISTKCYGRGRSLSDIGIPRIPKNLITISQKNQVYEIYLYFIFIILYMVYVIYNR